MLVDEIVDTLSVASVVEKSEHFEFRIFQGKVKNVRLERKHVLLLQLLSMY
jgi:hypothetical protein